MASRISDMIYPQRPRVSKAGHSNSTTSSQRNTLIARASRGLARANCSRWLVTQADTIISSVTPQLIDRLDSPPSRKIA